MGKLNHEEKAIEAAADAVVSLCNQLRGAKSLMTRSEAKTIAFGTVLAWTQGRSYGASVNRRGKAWVKADGKGYEPDGYTLGYAEAILPALAGVSGLPWDKPLSDWSKLEIIRLAAVSADLIDDNRSNVLEASEPQGIPI